jgi:hypothetical protein
MLFFALDFYFYKTNPKKKYLSIYYWDQEMRSGIVSAGQTPPGRTWYPSQPEGGLRLYIPEYVYIT